MRERQRLPFGLAGARALLLLCGPGSAELYHVHGLRVHRKGDVQDRQGEQRSMRAQIDHKVSEWCDFFISDHFPQLSRLVSPFRQNI